MTRVWRLCRAKYAPFPLSGEGARQFGGRWNSKGTRMAYFAASLSLACLEALVHLDLGDLPKDYVAIAVDIPDGLAVRTLAPEDLPPDWAEIPGPESLKDLGSAWVAAGREAVLRVPSAVIPTEWNVLVNPDHPDTARLTALPPHPFPFDPRFRAPGTGGPPG